MADKLYPKRKEHLQVLFLKVFFFIKVFHNLLILSRYVEFSKVLRNTKSKLPKRNSQT